MQSINLKALTHGVFTSDDGKIIFSSTLGVLMTTKGYHTLKLNNNEDYCSEAEGFNFSISILSNNSAAILEWY